MSTFNLPDLGEGLPDAEIHEWFVKEGEHVKTDQPLVSMETAKAVVEVPSPQDGTILKLFGKTGDIIKTGQPLVSFVSEENIKKNSSTVVGDLEEATSVSNDDFTIGSSAENGETGQGRIKATPAVKMLARKLQVDLKAIKGSGEHGLITKEDVERASGKNIMPEEGFVQLHGTRRAMLHSMIQSHKNVVPVSIFDEADVSNWNNETDITVCLIRAIEEAAKQEPALNAWFHTDLSAVKLFETVNLGLAMDSEAGLFVPVLANTNSKSNHELREIINKYKKDVKNRTLPPENFKDATFTLSNFGKFAGRFANPIIVPPQVAILGVGKMYEAPVSVNGNIVSHPLLPLSLTFDHRAITGGEATRFLGILIKYLQES